MASAASESRYGDFQRGELWRTRARARSDCQQQTNGQASGSEPRTPKDGAVGGIFKPKLLTGQAGR